MTLTALASTGLDMVALAVLVGALYIPRHGRRDLVAAYIGVNIGVLAVTLLLSSAQELGAGLGLGLFGVLSIIRLRSTALAQGEVAYFFAALALGLIGGMEANIGLTATLMALVLAALFVGDHPALMRRNRNQVVTLDRAVSDEHELTDHLEQLLNAKVLNLDIQRLDLVNDTTIVDVRYRLHRPQPRMEALQVSQAAQASPQPLQTQQSAPLAHEVSTTTPLPRDGQAVQPQGIATSTFSPQQPASTRRGRRSQQSPNSQQEYQSAPAPRQSQPAAPAQDPWTNSSWPAPPSHPNNAH